MPEDPPLHGMNPTRRFSERADSYARYRPDYPAAIIDAIFDGMGEPGRLVIADVGAGTGIASRMMAERGAHIVAIEPNEAMSGAAEPHGRVEFREVPAERTGLAGHSVNIVTAFQAFHWFVVGEALEEFRRILLPGGRLALAWNERNEDDPFTAEYSSLIRDISGNHPAERRAGLGSIPFSAHRFTDERKQVFPHSQTLDLAALLGRAESTSYLPSEEPGRSNMLGRLTELHSKRADVAGLVTLVYRTSLVTVTSPR